MNSRQACSVKMAGNWPFFFRDRPFNFRGGGCENKNKKFIHKKITRIKFVYKEAQEKDHASSIYSWDLYNRLVKKGNFTFSILLEQLCFGP